MESNQVLLEDDDDFYPMNDEETSDYYVEDETEPPQYQERAPATDSNANMDLFRYQESLFQEIASKKSASIRYELGTGSYFDYHFNRLSLKFQERIDESEITLNVFFALQEFIQAFKNCKTEETELRAALLTGYLTQIKEGVDREYNQPSKAEKIVDSHELVRFLGEEALLWRAEHPNTDFPDIQEKDISKELVQIEGDIKSQYVNLYEENLGKLLQRLKGMKICPLWHEKVCKRLELRKEVLRLMDKVKREEEILGGDQKDFWQSDKMEKEVGRYEGEVSDEILEKILIKKLQIVEEKDKMIVDGAEYKVSDSFDIPSSFILGGTYFDQKLKERSTDLELLSLRYGDLPIVKALKEIIEVVNLMLNTPCTWLCFVFHCGGLLEIVKDYEFDIKRIKASNELTIEIMIFMMRFVDIMRDLLNWKDETKSTHGDVKNSEVELLLQSIEVKIPTYGYEEYSIDVARLSGYMSAVEYHSRMNVLNEELDKLLKARLAFNNVGCVERFDGLVMRLEMIIERMKQVYKAKDKNYQALKKIYQEQKENIVKGVWNDSTKSLRTNELNQWVKDLHERFGCEFDHQTRSYYLSWVEELITMKIDNSEDVKIKKPPTKKGIKNGGVKKGGTRTATGKGVMKKTITKFTKLE